MKLAICHPVIEPRRGGSETYLSMLLHRLRRDGHDVHLVASRADASALPDGVTIHQVPDFSWPRLLRPWRFSQACREVLARLKPDLSLGFDKVAGVDLLYPLGGLHQASIVLGRDRFPAGWARWAATVFRRLDPSHWSMAAFERSQYLAPPRPQVVAISEMVRGHFPRFLGIPSKEIPVLHAAIDPERISGVDRPARRARTRDSWGLSPADVLALFVGFNPALKGLGPLMRAVARVPDPRLRLGVLSLRSPGPYQSMARHLGIERRVVFLGYQPDIRDAYFAADLLVHPTFYDPCSLVVLEAQAAGLPVVTTRSNGAAELLDPPHDSRVIGDPHDHQALADAIAAFVDDDVRRAASRAAMKSAEKWTFDDHYREFTRLLVAAHRRKQAA
jgi:UDP-glucose:(heptosyl)LPS alpha-1,3-glucosyltransferase